LEISRHALALSINTRPIIRKLAGCPYSGDAFLVGGAVRELALGETPRDYDLALSKTDDLKHLERLFGRSSFLLGKKPVQTHRIVTGDIVLDITIPCGTIEDDLARRDFTMNAIAFDITRDKIVDPLNGLDDISKKIIRYPRRDSIENDPLRMLKAIRHFASLENFILDGELIKAIIASKGLIRQTAPERVKYELDLIMLSKGVAKGIGMLETTGLIFEVFPELYALRAMDLDKGFALETFGHTVHGFSYLNPYVENFLGEERESAKDVGYALLFHDLGKAHTYSYDEGKGLVHFFHHERFSKEIALTIMERLRFSTHETRKVLALIENHMRIFLISTGEATEKAIKRLIYKMGDLTPLLVLLTICDMYGSSGGQDNSSTRRVMQNCDTIMTAYRESKKEPLERLLSGSDLLSMGFAEGPAIGRCINEVRDRQIAGDITHRGEALMFAQAFLKAQG